MRYVLATSRQWHQKIVENLGKSLGTFHLITEPGQLNLEAMRRISPEYIFFPHWSFIIPREVYENFTCVIFHMTDLPFGRGGSPLQNLISRGIYETKITAFKCVAELDAGPVYLKKPLSLDGSAQEIFIRSSGIMESMIQEIIEKKIEPIPQKGEIVFFKRRTPAQSEVPAKMDMAGLFDHIRMLDAEGYPKAFIKFDGFRVEFSRAQLKDGKITADARILKNEEDL